MSITQPHSTPSRVGRVRYIGRSARTLLPKSSRVSTKLPHPGLQRCRRGGACRFNDPCVVYTQWRGPTNGSLSTPLMF